MVLNVEWVFCLPWGMLKLKATSRIGKFLLSFCTGFWKNLLKLLKLMIHLPLPKCAVAGKRFWKIFQHSSFQEKKKHNQSYDHQLTIWKRSTWKRFVLVHDTRSNDSRSNDARFMHNYTFLCMPINRVERGAHPITLRDSKILLSNSNRAWFPSLETIIR